jgi:hypothetical protein
LSLVLIYGGQGGECWSWSLGLGHEDQVHLSQCPNRGHPQIVGSGPHHAATYIRHHRCTNQGLPVNSTLRWPDLPSAEVVGWPHAHNIIYDHYVSPHWHRDHRAHGGHRHPGSTPLLQATVTHREQRGRHQVPRVTPMADYLYKIQGMWDPPLWNSCSATLVDP